MTRTRSVYLAAVILLALVAFFVRAASLDTQSLWRDEVDALRFATAPWSEMLSNFTRPGWNGPLYYLLLRGWVALTGTSEYAMRFFSLALGVLCVPLIAVLGRRLLNPVAGPIAALLVTTSPYLVWYSQEVKMYTLVPALALLAIYSLRRAVEGDGWPWWVVQVVATTMAFYAHILAALLIPVQALLYVAWWPRARREWPGALISLACLTVPYLPLVVWQAPLALQVRETGFYHYSFRQMGDILLNGWSTGMHGWGLRWSTALMSLLVIASPLSLIGSLPSPSEREKTWRMRIGNRLALLIWLVIPFLFIWIISLRQPLFTDRYLIWTAPAFYLMIASSLGALASSESWIRWAVVPLIGILLLSNGVNLWKQASDPLKSDFRAAAAYVADYPESKASTAREERYNGYPFNAYLPLVAAERPASDELIIFQIPHGRYTFDYYFPRDDYAWADGLYTNPREPDGPYMSEREATRHMRAMTEGYDVVWLIATEVPMWDEHNLVQRWLDEHLTCVAEDHFTRVDVYRYVK